ncbi:MAG TPA: xanthine dehydrogenase family protein subunit M [Streptosporangiaceae bacterium]|nr:xanthine dehydrogenase family protein subunit M [Streptosporangiaceae bacterium]
MKPVDFTLHQPAALAQAAELLAAHPDESKILAGGQSLLPLLNFRLARPQHLIALDRVGGLAGIGRDASGLHVGAMVRHACAERSSAVARDCPLMAAAIPQIAHPPIRNRGTVGGSLVHADPAAELPAVARALDVTFHAVSVRGTRDIPAAAFFHSYLTTDLADDEILTGISVPPCPPRTGSAFCEVARRRGDFAIAGVAAQVTVDGGTLSDVRLALSGVAGVPHRCTAAEDVLRDATPAPDVLDAAVTAEQAMLHPSGDLHGTADYRLHLAGVLLRRAVLAAYANAAGPRPQAA